jgi:predicted transcriptional regulator
LRRARATDPDLRKALGVFGPLEARILRAVWTGKVRQPFAVHQVQALMPELAYTSVMTTLNRLVTKGLLGSEHVKGVRAHQYVATGTPSDYLAVTGRRQAADLVDRLGDAALAAFAAELDELTPEQRHRLRELGNR